MDRSQAQREQHTFFTAVLEHFGPHISTSDALCSVTVGQESIGRTLVDNLKNAHCTIEHQNISDACVLLSLSKKSKENTEEPKDLSPLFDTIKNLHTHSSLNFDSGKDIKIPRAFLQSSGYDITPLFSDIPEHSITHVKNKGTFVEIAKALYPTALTNAPAYTKILNKRTSWI